MCVVREVQQNYFEFHLFCICRFAGTELNIADAKADLPFKLVVP